MSATAFQRLRREQEAKRLVEIEKPDNHVPTVAELKALLDEKGIEYTAKAKKEELINLLIEADKKVSEKEPPAADELPETDKKVSEDETTADELPEDNKVDTNNPKLEGAE